MNDYSLPGSRLVWTVAAIAVFNVLETVSPFLPPQYAAPASGLINLVGFFLATYFHVNPSQHYNPPQG